MPNKSRETGIAKVLTFVVVLCCVFTPSTMALAAVLERNEIVISVADLAAYIEERIAPDLYESALTKPDAVKQSVKNLYVIRRAAMEARAERLVSDEELDTAARRAAELLALKRFTENRTDAAMAETDWEALARELYLTQQDPKAASEQVEVQHILVSTSDRSYDEVVDRVAVIRDLLDSGADFNSVALEYSDDSSIEFNAGSLGFIAQGQTHPNFEKQAFSMSTPGEISDPVFTSFGFHLIQYLSRRAIPRPSFEEQRDTLIRALKKSRPAQLRPDLFLGFQRELGAALEQLDEKSIAAEVLFELQTGS